jgi:hypothetical protein
VCVCVCFTGLIYDILYFVPYFIGFFSCNLFDERFVLCDFFYRKCIVTSYYFVVLLKQTTEVKTLPILHVTQFHNSRPAISQTASSSTAHVPARTVPFEFHDATHLAQCMVFSWYFPFPVSTLTLMLSTHNMTTVDATQSENSATSVTKTSVCLSLQYQ